MPGIPAYECVFVDQFASLGSAIVRMDFHRCDEVSAGHCVQCVRPVCRGSIAHAVAATLTAGLIEASVQAGRAADRCWRTSPGAAIDARPARGWTEGHKEEARLVVSGAGEPRASSPSRNFAASEAGEHFGPASGDTT